MRWREPVSTVSRSGFPVEALDARTSDNSSSKAMHARIVPKVQFAHLASRYGPNLRLEESITKRRKKVIPMYTAKVRIAPSRAVVCNPFQNSTLFLLQL